MNPTPSKNKTARSRARSFALQALYQHLVGGNPSESIDAHTRGLQGFNKADSDYYQRLFYACIQEQAQLDALILLHLDRPLTEISPIERAALWLGAYELQYCPDIPYRVVLNEAIELTKSFGGSDGYKYTNGVLHALANALRPNEPRSNKIDDAAATTTCLPT